MKKSAIIVALLIVALPLFGQTSSPSQWSIGVGAEGGVPTGDFNNVSSFGIGGMAWVGYTLDPSFIVALKGGYLRFSGKDVTLAGLSSTGGDTTVSGASLSVVPILIEGKYFFMPTGDTRVYGAADVGLYMLSSSATGATSSSKFGVAPTLGAQFKVGDKMYVDAHANYSVIFTDVSNTSFVGFGLGLVFDLQ